MQLLALLSVPRVLLEILQPPREWQPALHVRQRVAALRLLQMPMACLPAQRVKQPVQMDSSSMHVAVPAQGHAAHAALDFIKSQWVFAIKGLSLNQRVVR
jgi:hypothetical protein